MRYFTSDQHFFDTDIMSYTNRPYATPEEMNDDIISRFIESTRDASEIYILGDIFGSKIPANPYDSCREVMARLGVNEKPFNLILGNHDSLSAEEFRRMGFASVERMGFVELDGMKTMLTHDPCMIQPRNTLAICGHIHTLFKEVWQPERNILAINVGVEVRGFAPISEREILDIVKGSQYRRQ